MNREEFLMKLQESLTGKVPEQIVNDNINYYRNYINEQIRYGKNEADVLGVLGDPRLIAKTIEESNNFVSEGYDYDANYSQKMFDRQTRSKKTNAKTGSSFKKKIVLPGWMIAAIIILVILLFFMLIFKVISFFMPFIIVSVVFWGIYRFVNNMIGKR